MAVHPLRPATDRCLGGPLPRQLANQTQTHRKAVAYKYQPPLINLPCGRLTTFGISSPFGLLSPSLRQVVYALLTRLPLGFQKQAFNRPVRLACVRHAASVRPEPGSNSPIKFIEEPIGSYYLKKLPIAIHYVSLYQSMFIFETFVS